MAEFQELIKNFDRIRDYMRQFYIYGFKVRNDFDSRSARTYDNERRRIESWLGDYTCSSYTTKGKQVYINIDSKTVPENPLYAAWKSKSFTDNDILLHFFILDQLTDHPRGMNASALSDAISLTYGVAFDPQTVRLKLKEYESLGLLCSHKEGKNLIYQMLPPQFPHDSPLNDTLLTAVSGNRPFRVYREHHSGLARPEKYLFSVQASFYRTYPGRSGAPAKPYSHPGAPFDRL